MSETKILLREEPTFPCRFCNREFETHRGKASHEGQSHRDKTQMKRICKICKKKFEVRLHNLGRRKYCSQKCFRLDEEIPKQVSKTLSGRKNPSHSVFMKSLWKEEEFHKHMVDAHIGQTPWNEGKTLGPLSEEQKEKISRSLIKAFKEGRAISPMIFPEIREMISILATERKLTKEHRKSLSKALKRCWENSEWAEARMKKINVKPNKLESYVMSLMKDFSLSFKYVGNGYTFIAGKNPDFINFEKKKIIEVFGNYWHKKEEEEERTIHFKKYGYDTLVLWENDINSTEKEEIAKQIGDFVG